MKCQKILKNRNDTERSSRDRHAVRRADEPQPLSRRGDSLSAHASTSVAGDRRWSARRWSERHDRPCRAKLDRRLCEVPVGFKWFVPGLFNGSCCFGGEESAGASFLRHDGTVWTTDKDGPIMNLLAAEITARTGKDPGEHYRELTAEFGTAYYTRIDAPATPEQKERLESCRPMPSRRRPSPATRSPPS